MVSIYYMSISLQFNYLLGLALLPVFVLASNSPILGEALIVIRHY
jgi:hypothetical protein